MRRKYFYKSLHSLGQPCIYLFRKLRFFSHSKCKESQSITDLSSIDNLNEVGINNPGYNLKRSKSAEQLNIDVRPPLQRSQTVFSADDTSDPNADGYLQSSSDVIQVGSPSSVRSRT